MSSSDKDGASCDDACDVSDMLHNMSTSDNEGNISVCANCGKEGSSDEINNICNKCKQVKYCNAACKKKHRSKHKKQCEEHLKLAAAHSAKLHDEKLFKQPPPQFGDCPICFVQLPTPIAGRRYYACCGKEICGGCCYAPVYDNQGNKVDDKKCPFCRTPWPTSDEEVMERYKVRMELSDPIAIFNVGVKYRDGKYGYPQDHNKALELWHQAAELGYAEAYLNIGYAYSNGKGVEVDKKKAKHYYELAAIKGDVLARHNLGVNEYHLDNMDRAIKHFIIAVGYGSSQSLDNIKMIYSKGYATKDDYMKALQSYQEYLGKIKSSQRDKAAAAKDEYRYY